MKKIEIKDIKKNQLFTELDNLGIPQQEDFIALCDPYQEEFCNTLCWAIDGKSIKDGEEHHFNKAVDSNFPFPTLYTY